MAAGGTRLPVDIRFVSPIFYEMAVGQRTTLGGANRARLDGELLNIEQGHFFMIVGSGETGNNGQIVIVTIISGNSHPSTGVSSKTRKRVPTRGGTNFYYANRRVDGGCS